MGNSAQGTDIFTASAENNTSVWVNYGSFFAPIRCGKDGTKRMYSIVDARMHNAVDALTPELVSVLQKEVITQMSCSQNEDE